MSNKTTDILVIVEGGKKEPDLLRRWIELYELDAHVVASYETDIYTLYKTMFQGRDPRHLDILAHMREHEKDIAKKAIFNKRYARIYLIFDFDPQAKGIYPDDGFSPKKIREMQKYFDEPTEAGKLYINYPMVESFHHMKSIPDVDFNSYNINIDKLHPKNQYKEIINSICPDPRKFATSRQECTIVIKQNIEKAHNITGHTSEDLIPDATKILEAQLNKLHNENSIAILCTCAFYIAEYNPKLLE